MIILPSGEVHHSHKLLIGRESGSLLRADWICIRDSSVRRNAERTSEFNWEQIWEPISINRALKCNGAPE
jgi:hypothetical protein